MKIYFVKYLLFLLIHYIEPTKSNELLELSCLSSMECKQFQLSGLNVDCIDERCQCTNATGDHVKCKPMERKLSNIIGGPCPCQQPNAECNVKEDTCYCATDFMPSSDKRRCIKKTAELFEDCELDVQCQRTDYNAICHRDFKLCICMDQFVNDTGSCVSIVGPKFLCENNTQCFHQFGENSLCFTDTTHCVCVDGYIASFNNLQCLRVSKYLENCVENMQCIATMGLGGRCELNACQCDSKYFVEERKLPDGELESVCTAVVERGQYCRYNEDCYQRQLSELDQTMDCIYGECNCKFGFNVFNDGGCIRGSEAAAIESKMYSIFVLCILCLVIFN